MVVRSECRSAAPLSTTVAFSASTRTTARFSGTTHNGSYVALRTSAAPVIKPIERRPPPTCTSEPDNRRHRTPIRVVSRHGKVGGRDDDELPRHRYPYRQAASVRPRTQQVDHRNPGPDPAD